MNSNHIFIHTFGRGLSHGGLCTPKGGEVKVNWKPRPSSKHQTMWTIPGHSRVGGIVGMHYLSQVSWPVGLFVFCQLPNHSHYGLVQSLHQPISLQMVRCCSQFHHAEDLAHFIDDTTHKVSTSVTQEPGWDPKYQDVTLIQKLGDTSGCLIGGHICQYMLHEVVLEYQDISNFR